MIIIKLTKSERDSLLSALTLPNLCCDICHLKPEPDDADYCDKYNSKGEHLCTFLRDINNIINKLEVNND